MRGTMFGALTALMFVGLLGSGIAAASAADTKCDATTTFVFVPSDAMLKRMGISREKYLADYLKKNAGPSDEELKKCGLTREGWRELIRDKVMKH